MLPTRTGGVVKSVDCALLAQCFAPDVCIDLAQIAIDGQTVLEEFLAVLEDVFGNVAEVQVEVATCSCFAVIDEGVHHPELDVFDVGVLEICHLQLAHHAAPTLFGVGQCAVGVHAVGIEVVGAAFVGVEGEVEGVEGVGLVVGEVFVGVDFGVFYGADVVV